RMAIPQEFLGPDQQVKIQRDIEADDAERKLPENTVEERDVRGLVAARIRKFWVPKGVIQGPAFEEAFENGTFSVKVDDTDEEQLNIFLPLKVVKGLAKVGLFAAKEG